MDKKQLSRRTFILGGIASLVYFYYEVHSVAVKRYTVKMPGLPKDFEGFTILHLTDLHSKEYGHKQEQLLQLINRESFDMVAITGDVVDKRNQDMQPALSLVEGLSAKPVFFVPGNHEWRTGFAIQPYLEERGAKILLNTHYRYTKASSHIWITGVDDPYLHRDRLNEALSHLDSRPKILLAHAPNIFQAAVQAGVDLALIGHTHGGQVKLPLIGAVVAPGQGLFPEFDYGEFSSGATHMIINGGLGESVLPIRLCNRPEIVLVKLMTSG